MARSYRYEVGVGCLMVGAGGVLVFLSLQLGALASLGDATRVTTRISDAAGLETGASVSVAGVKVGTVASLVLDHDVAVATLSLNVDADIGKDAVVRVRARSLLGEKYLEISPGVRGGPRVEDGDGLVCEGSQIEIDELVARLAPMLDGLDVAALQRVLTSITKRLDEDPELVGRLLDNADHLLTNGAAVSDRLAPLADDASLVFADGRDLIATVDSRVRDAGELLDHAGRSLDRVDAATAEMPAFVEDARAVAADARSITGAVRRHEDDVEIVLDNLAGFNEDEIRRLLREEGVLVRLRPKRYPPKE